MGRKSKKGTKGGSTSSATTSQTIPSLVLRNEDWELIAPFRSYQEMLGSVSCQELTNESLPTSGTWRVYIRRANWWCENNDTQESKRKYRCWWISFLVMSSKEEKTTMKMISLFVEDFQNKDSGKHPLTCDMFLAALDRVIDKLKSRPTDLMFWPAAKAAFRIRSIQSLVAELASQVGGMECKILPGAQDPLEDAVDGCTRSIYFDGDSNDPEEELFTAERCEIARFLEHQLSYAEERLNNLGCSRSFKIPCITHNLDLSIVVLRMLFRAAKTFHQARPWEVLANHQPLTVTVPASTDPQETNTRTLFIVVAGRGSWEGRGIHAYNSFDDMICSSCEEKRPLTLTGIDETVLLYFDRGMTSFRTLDHIEELGLEIASNDGYGGEHSYPCFCHNDTFMNLLSEAEMCNFGSVSPKKEDLEPLALALLAITKFVVDYHAEVEIAGRSIIMLTPEGRLPIKIDLTAEGRDPVVAIVELHHLNPVDCRYANVHSDKHLESMSIGDTKACNFCQTPEKMKQEEAGGRLLSCSRCKSIHYCSKRCQVSDWSRHKKECRRHS